MKVAMKCLVKSAARLDIAKTATNRSVVSVALSRTATLAVIAAVKIATQSITANSVPNITVPIARMHTTKQVPAKTR